jgi:hypothetical protein
VQLRATSVKSVWSGRGLLQTTLALAFLISARLAADEKDPLHVRIDRAVDAVPIAPAVPLADDASFLRRVTLDLAGRIPSPAETRAFLQDSAPGKRAALIDRLLASPEHARHMAVTFDVWLMERRADRHVKSDEWRTWLAAFVAANRPYNELPRDLLASDGSEPLLRPAARFVLDREVSPDALTRDVGRVFFGMDLECAQCHDHPRIDDYVQRDYYGLYAFVNRLYLFQPDGKKPAVVAEKAEGDVAFKSVFTQVEGNTRPRLPDGSAIDEPAFAKGEEYQVKSIRPIPKYSRRTQLAKLLGEGAGRSFNRNIVNRLWAHLMGRGLVEPLDLHHSDNPPAHPELLEMLASEFAAMKYDLRAFLRELALTRTYQRSIEMPAVLDDLAKAAAAKLPALEAETAKLKDAAGRLEEAAKKTNEEFNAGRKALSAVAAELAKAETAAADARKARDAAQKEHDARQELRKAVAEAAEKAADPRLADDPDLAAAAATFRARVEKLTAEVAPLAKDLADKSAALSKAEAALEATKARRTELEGQAAAKADLHAKADAARRSGKVASVHAARVAADARALADYGALQAAVARSREAVQQAKAELAAAKEAATRPPEEIEAKLAEARKAHDAARAELAAKEEQLKAVTEAAQKAEEVAKKAGKDPELTAAAAKVKARKDARAAEAAALQAACAQAGQRLSAAEQVRTARERIPSIEARIKAATAQAAADQGRRNDAFARLAALWTERFAVGGLDALTPEQICWSMMQAAGVVDLQRAAARAEAEKKAVPEAEVAKVIEQAVYDKLKGNEAAFVKVFGSGPGTPQDEFYATVDQALFLANGALVRGWLAPNAGNLADRLMKLEDPQAFAEELYLSALTRMPSEAESADVARHLAKRPQARLAAVQELIWATLTSVEFRFKH